MSNDKKKNSSRRKFLGWGLFAAMGFVTEKSIGKSLPIPDVTGKKIKMLTADGLLVEVDEQMVLAAKKGVKATNPAILDWRTLENK